MAVSGKHRPLIPIPLPTRWISVWFLNVITSVPPTIAKALIQGLKHDLIADDRALRALIPQTLIPFDQAVRRTLKEEEQLVNSSDWGYDAQAFARWRPGLSVLVVSRHADGCHLSRWAAYRRRSSLRVAEGFLSPRKGRSVISLGYALALRIVRIV